MSFDASNETGGASVETGAQAESGVVQKITSVGGTIAVTTTAGGTIVNLEVVGSGVFPGFGGAPPQIAGAGSAGVSPTASRSDHTHAGVTSVNGAQGAIVITAFPGFGGPPPQVNTASSTGIAATASHSDHTHAQDLSVVYVPSNAAMQASGIVQQTYAAPNATPSALTATASSVLVGLASGLYSNATLMWYNTTASNLVVTSTGTTATPATTSVVGAQLWLIGDSGTGIGAGMRVETNSAGVASNTQIVYRHSRGSFAAKTALILGDVIYDHISAAHDGSGYVNSCIFATVIPTDGTVSTGNVTQIVGHYYNTGAATSLNIANLGMGMDTDANVYLGITNMATGGLTRGYVYIPASPGPLTAVPSQVNGSTRAQRRVPTVIDDTDQRNYAYMGGAWHYTIYDDYTPTATRIPFGAATAGKTTDSASLSYDTTNSTLNLVGSAGAQAPIIINGGSAANIAINLKGGAATILENANSGINIQTIGTGAVSLISAAGTCLQVDQNGNVALGFQNPLATNASNGFPYMRNNGAAGVGGAPTGVPTLPFNGMNPFQYDETNHKFWLYDRSAAAWKGVVLT